MVLCCVVWWCLAHPPPLPVDSGADSHQILKNKNSIFVQSQMLYRITRKICYELTREFIQFELKDFIN